MIAESIREYLREHGITQEHVASKAGMTKQAMSASMRGTRTLTADEYVAICAALGVSMDFFAPKVAN